MALTMNRRFNTHISALFTENQTLREQHEKFHCASEQACCRCMCIGCLAILGTWFKDMVDLLMGFIVKLAHSDGSTQS